MSIRDVRGILNILTFFPMKEKSGRRDYVLHQTKIKVQNVVKLIIKERQMSAKIKNMDACIAICIHQVK